MISCDAYGVQAGELSHAIEYAHADRDVGRLRVGSACLQIKTRERFEPRHRILGQRTTVIAAAALLPFPAAEPYDRVARSVAPCGARHGRLPVTGALARHGTASSRTHHRLVRYQIVRRPESSRSIGQDIAVSNVMMRHQRGLHLTGACVEREIHLAPRAAFRIAILADLIRLRRVDLQMNWVAVANDRQLYIKRLCAASRRCVVRYRQGGEGQVVQTLRKTLQGAQWQAKHGL